MTAKLKHWLFVTVLIIGEIGCLRVIYSALVWGVIETRSHTLSAMGNPMGFAIVLIVAILFAVLIPPVVVEVLREPGRLKQYAYRKAIAPRLRQPSHDGSTEPERQPPTD